MSRRPQITAGLPRKLVVAFDVGTTYSGIAYAWVNPGEVPKVKCVTRFPGQENIAGSNKIPSVLWYDRDGNVRAVGAEAMAPSIRIEAEENSLIFVQWFKLHLSPDFLKPSETLLPSLPFKKSAVDVFSDMLRYLFSCARTYIIGCYANGASLWDSVDGEIEFILSHPNGWEGMQQSKMRMAAVMAGIIRDTRAGHSHIHFVTEGEASLQFCINHGLMADSIKVGQSVMVVDAGGGTVDLSTYSFTAVSPIAVEEIAPTDCILQGSTMINSRAEVYLRELLRRSAFAHDIDDMLDAFEKSAKPIFKDPIESSYIKFGTIRDNDPGVRIRRGQLVLPGAVVAEFFEPSITGIVCAVEKQCRLASSPVKVLFLVGGFAASHWLYSQLQEYCQPYGLKVFRPDGHSNKAVAEGSVSYYLENYVSTRVAKLTYGVSCDVPYDEKDPEHFKRRSNGTKMGNMDERRHDFSMSGRDLAALNCIRVVITCYRGKNSNPKWMDVESYMFSELCIVVADTSQVNKIKHKGSKGVSYSLTFDVILFCGLTELQAQISWMENGTEKRGPAEIVYDAAYDER